MAQLLLAYIFYFLTNTLYATDSNLRVLTWTLNTAAMPRQSADCFSPDDQKRVPFHHLNQDVPAFAGELPTINPQVDLICLHRLPDPTFEPDFLESAVATAFDAQGWTTRRIPAQNSLGSTVLAWQAGVEIEERNDQIFVTKNMDEATILFQSNHPPLLLFREAHTASRFLDHFLSIRNSFSPVLNGPENALFLSEPEDESAQNTCLDQLLKEFEKEKTRHQKKTTQRQTTNRLFLDVTDYDRFFDQKHPYPSITLENLHTRPPFQHYSEIRIYHDAFKGYSSCRSLSCSASTIYGLRVKNTLHDTLRTSDLKRTLETK